MTLSAVDPQMQLLGFALDFAGDYPVLDRRDGYAPLPLADSLLISPPQSYADERGAWTEGYSFSFGEHRLRYAAAPLVIVGVEMRLLADEHAGWAKLIVLRGRCDSLDLPPRVQRDAREQAARFILTGTLEQTTPVGSIAAHRFTTTGAMPLFAGPLD